MAATRAASNQGGGSGGDNRGFAGMDDQQQRDIARQGGETSANTQDRDEQGQFSGKSGRSGGSGPAADRPVGRLGPGGSSGGSSNR